MIGWIGTISPTPTKRRRERKVIEVPVAKDKTRVMITLSKKQLESIKALLKALGNKTTISQLIEISLGFFIESTLKELKSQENKEAAKNA